SLVVDRPQPASSIRAELAELCRGAEDLAPILLSFRNKEWVRIGSRDILGREPIRDVTRELADVAEAIVGQVARNQWDRRREKLGVPRRASDDRRSRWSILGLGKFGGREMTYLSDLDLVFLFDEEGMTRGEVLMPNSQFFADLAKGIIRSLEGAGGQSHLYHTDMRLRPHGSSGPLAVSLSAFEEYYNTRAQTWERLALTRARVLFSQGTFGRDVSAALQRILTRPVDPVELAEEVEKMRNKRIDARRPNDLKCSPGGLVDIEFLVQYLLLKHGSTDADILRPNLWDALDALKRAGILTPEEHADLRDAYAFLRSIEARLRIVHNRTEVTLPESTEELGTLAVRLNYECNESSKLAESLLSDARRHASRTLALFERIVHSQAASARPPASPSPREGARG
ncbi:MAG TPA: bifunctional [glutamate--ammonia ligase]-adenylyl-L-tyrosine phosphorylase/[glutamate--ammonia-ligase] adenylyltransferase, partial [Isosphaeraceae bacterium]|nr:bifunctional [glutamate--ammonia ligase]-adenylyl-L-tyrosine phosphorylase/[glutamate--ammonia-ligase] adenylyltransferase [Isosphaeraceae bacterium]